MLNPIERAAERAASRLHKGMSHADYKRIIDEEYANERLYRAIFGSGCACGASDTSTCHLAEYGHGNLCESCHAVGAPVVQ